MFRNQGPFKFNSGFQEWVLLNCTTDFPFKSFHWQWTRSLSQCHWKIAVLPIEILSEGQTPLSKNLRVKQPKLGGHNTKVAFIWIFSNNRFCIKTTTKSHHKCSIITIFTLQSFSTWYVISSPPPPPPPPPPSPFNLSHLEVFIFSNTFTEEEKSGNGGSSHHHRSPTHPLHTFYCRSGWFLVAKWPCPDLRFVQFHGDFCSPQVAK